MLSSGSSDNLFIHNTKSPGCFNQAHNGFLCSSSVILAGAGNEPAWFFPFFISSKILYHNLNVTLGVYVIYDGVLVSSYVNGSSWVRPCHQFSIDFLSSASTLNPSNMVDYDPGLNLASLQGRHGLGICSGAGRRCCGGCSLLISHDGEPRCGSAGTRSRWLLSTSALRLALPSCHIWRKNSWQLRCLQGRTERERETDCRNNPWTYLSPYIHAVRITRGPCCRNCRTSG